MPIAYPTDEEVEAFLQASGILTGPLNAAFAGAAEAARIEFERMTGYTPFLSSEDEQTRVYDPPMGCLLLLRGGLTSISSVMLDTLELTGGVDYWIEPANALAKGQPITALRLATRFYGLPQSLAVTGLWGYSATLPQDVFNAILRRAALDCKLGIEGSTGMATSKKLGSLEVSHSVTLAQQQSESWQNEFKRAVARYKRWEVV